ncbi:16S rRNA methyltransferase [Oceanicola sp. 22II-s10i]|uniref:16S rRNA (guanine(527)-N(7))-methyltransferase RsmG n=1 Tax=Oceanicola sp. 22II-s10i TaxID=1317116 RepID=UPI000B52716C|nr:16S rRNA (guanine(527)-N(7))-methyltransferase RsmG [Oceanicola sp. 22II-s10i]OWU85984.1 16S rRNA methyltransferase [Oceanicola sp. 22II-s10i]
MNDQVGFVGDVSRETIERLKIYAELLQKWNPKINMVAPATLPDLWTRHIADSQQISFIQPLNGQWLDLGSGGGFPGIVLAILGAEDADFHMTLMESDQRKCSFLATVLRETGVSAKVVDARIEVAPPAGVDVLTARALAPLVKLLEYAERHLKPDGTALFPKGESWKTEIAKAEEHWRFDWVATPSTTNKGSVVLKVGARHRV